MQRQTNELEILIGEAFRRGDPAFLGHVLGIIYNKPDLTSSNVTKADIEHLNKLAGRAFSVSTYYVVGLVYDLILTNRLLDIAALKADVLLTVANCLLNVSENVKGTLLAGQMARYIRALSKTIRERPDLTHEEQGQLNTLLNQEALQNMVFLSKNEVSYQDEESDEVEEIIRLSVSKMMQDKISAILKMIDLLCACSNLQEQIEVFGRKMLNIFTFVTSGTNETFADLFEILATFIETILFQADYAIKIDQRSLDPNLSPEKNLELFVHLNTDRADKPASITEIPDGTKNDTQTLHPVKTTQTIKYTLVEPKALIKEVDGVYAAIAFVLNLLILYPKLSKLQLVCIRLLERLYDYYPAHRKKSDELLILFFSNIGSETSEDVRKAATVFLYKLLKRDGSEALRTALEARESLQIIFNSVDYNSSVLNDTEVFDLQDLSLKAGFPFCRVIGAGSTRSEYIEVWQPYSILSFGFVIFQHDVTFSLERVARFKHVLAREKDEVFTLVKNLKIDSTKRAVRGNILIKEPGIYRVEIDNKTSWFNSKTLRYRLLVLSPNFEQSPELKGTHEALIEATLGQIFLPSQIFGPDVHGPVDVASGKRTIIPKTFAVAKILIHVNSKTVQISTASKAKNDIAILTHESENFVDWEYNNIKIEELFRDLMTANSGQKDGKIHFRIVYDEGFMEKQLNLGRSALNFREVIESYFKSSIPLISKISQDLIEGKPQIITEMEFQVQRLASDTPWFNSQTFIMFVINHGSKSVQCKLRKETKETFDIDLADFVVPIVSKEKDGKRAIELKPAEILLFDEDIHITKRIAYLAFLTHCIFCSSIRSIKDFVILEDVPVLSGSKSFNRIQLKEAIDSYYTKYKKSEIQAHSLEQLNPLNLHFYEHHKGSNVTL